MMLTTKAHYAVMAILDMGIHTNACPIKLSDIAARQDIDLRYLEQIFKKLKQAQIVHSIRGPGGGYLLSMQHQDITIYKIVAAVEENIELTRCKNSAVGCMNPNEKCMTHHLWGGLTSHIKNYLSQITVDDVLLQGKKIRGQI